MSRILEQAKLFFDACETGKGWEGCSAYCHPDATFSAQAAAISDIETVEGYSGIFLLRYQTEDMN